MAGRRDEDVQGRDVEIIRLGTLREKIDIASCGARRLGYIPDEGSGGEQADPGQAGGDAALFEDFQVHAPAVAATARRPRSACSTQPREEVSESRKGFREHRSILLRRRHTTPGLIRRGTYVPQVCAGR